MKKSLFGVVLTVTLAALFLAVLPTRAEATTYYTEGDYTFTVTNNEATITRYAGVGGDIAIPATLGGYSVTAIGASAFQSCDSLTSVAIGNSVSSIGNDAFYSCKNLTTMSISDSVTTIGERAFMYCEGLFSVTIGNSVTTIDARAFSNCNNLTTLTLGDSVTTMGDCAFDGCNIEKLIIAEGSKTITYTMVSKIANESVKEVIIPDSVTTIGDSAFGNCTRLKTVTIPDNVTTIDARAFFGCTGLSAVSIGDSVYSIGDDAFGNCSSLTVVTIPDSVTTIGKRAFSQCWDLTTLTIGDGVTHIGELAFSDCSCLTDVYIKDIAAWCSISFDTYQSNPLYYCDGNLFVNGVLVKDLVIPNSATTIGKYAFYFCTNLTSVTIGDGVSTIGNQAFYKCTNLTSVIIGEGVTTIDSEAFYYCENLTSVTMGSRVTAIGEYAFCGCKSLKAMTVPDSVTTIGNYAFQYCTNLTTVTIGDCVTAIGDSAFNGCYVLTTVTIPDSVITIGSAAFDICGRLTDVYYGGTEAQWENISVGSGNGYLLSATIHIINTTEVSPTCTADGYIAYICSCGEITKEVYEETKLGHSFTNYKSDNNATCTADGTETAKCDRCDITDTHIVVGSATGHHHEAETTLQTCTMQGYTTHTCACGDIYVDDYVDPLGHSFTVYKSNNDATCTADGTETAKCDRCEVTDTQKDTGSAKGHDHKPTVTAPTCLERGYTTHTCSCGDIYVDTYTDALDHSFTNYTSNNNATCEEDGTVTAKCDRCKVIDTQADTGSKLGHSFSVYKSNNDATCTADGTETAKCDRCEVTDTQKDTGSAKGHDHKPTVTAPTCLERGYTTHTCFCGDTYVDTYTDALGHSFTNYTSNNDATCEEDGTVTAKCDRCEATDTQVDLGSKLGHNYQGGTCVNCQDTPVGVAITKQPVSVKVGSGKTAAATVVATGDGLTYQWYYKERGASKFSLTGSFKGNTYSVSMTSSRNGRQVYCVITDAYGNSVKTSTVTLSMKFGITKQPQSMTVIKNKTARISVSAEGDGLTYQWYYRTKPTKSFKKLSSAKSSSYSVKMTSGKNGYQYYCVVKDKYGNTAKTNTVTLKVAPKLKITKQPTSTVKVNAGKMASATVRASGDGLTYKWYYKDKGMSGYKLTTSFKTATYSVQMNAARSGRKVYCVVTDKYGQTVKSKTVTLYAKTTITKQPVSVKIENGKKAVVSVSAAGEKLSYKWYVKKPGARKFSLVKSFKGNSYSCTMSNAYNGCQVYCVVKSKYGGSIRTATVTIARK